MTAFDLAVVGAGSAGLSVAAAAAQLGQRVVLFEKSDMGGDCLNTGCVPSKALLAAAKAAQAQRTSAPFGIQPVDPVIDFAKVMDHVQSVIATIAPVDSQSRFEGLGVTVVRAAARFANATTLEAQGQHYSARRIVLATGSRPTAPPIPGLADVPFLTNESIFQNRVRPQHLVIIGAGPIGLEMAQAHRRLGCAVTVLEAARPLARDDADLAQTVLEALQAEGVVIHTGVQIERVSHAASGFTVQVKGLAPLTGSHLLVAAGRAANVDGLNLQAAGIAHTAKGITVDHGLRTSNRRVYAIGDCAGGPQFTHAANYQAGLVIRSALFRLPVRNRPELMPWVTYTDPELAHVGLSEQAARQRWGTAVRVLRAPYHDNDRAVTERRTEGQVKLVVSPRGRVVGASIVGEGAGEQIALWVLAVNRQVKLSALAGLVLPYPTRAEAGKRAVLSHYSAVAANPWLRRLIAVLKWLD